MKNTGKSEAIDLRHMVLKTAFGLSSLAARAYWLLWEQEDFLNAEQLSLALGCGLHSSYPVMRQLEERRLIYYSPRKGSYERATCKAEPIEEAWSKYSEAKRSQLVPLMQQQRRERPIGDSLLY